MNRLSPLIVRRPRSAAFAGGAVSAGWSARPIEDAPTGSGDLRLFATNFLAGLAFFGAYLA